MNRRFTLSVTAVLLALSGCIAAVTVDPFEMPSARGAAVPSRVGVYYSPEFRSYEVREQLFDDTGSMALETDIGPASVSTIDSTLRSAFAEVVEVGSIDPPELSSGTIEAVITPRITGFDYVQTGGGETIVRIGYELLITDVRGRNVLLVVDTRFEEFGNPGSFTFEPIGSGAPRKISAAMREAAAALWFQLNAVAYEDDWLAALQLRNDEALKNRERLFSMEGRRCAVYLYLSEHGYSQALAGEDGGVNVAVGEREATLSSAGQYVRFDLEAGQHSIVYGESHMVELLPIETSLVQSIEFDCLAGESAVFELEFVHSIEIRHREVSVEYAVQQIELWTEVAAATRVDSQ